MAADEVVDEVVEVVELVAELVVVELGEGVAEGETVFPLGSTVTVTTPLQTLEDHLRRAKRRCEPETLVAAHPCPILQPVSVLT